MRCLNISLEFPTSLCTPGGNIYLSVYLATFLLLSPVICLTLKLWRKLFANEITTSYKRDTNKSPVLKSHTLLTPPTTPTTSWTGFATLYNNVMLFHLLRSNSHCWDGHKEPCLLEICESKYVFRLTKCMQHHQHYEETFILNICNLFNLILICLRQPKQDFHVMFRHLKALG